MSDAPLAISLAFFDLRPDRDTRTYYRALLESFASAYPGRIRVFTNDASVFPSNIETVELLDLEPRLKETWDDPNWREVVTDTLRRNPRNAKLIQQENPTLLLPWFSKVSLIRQTLREVEHVLWIDAGLLYSVDYGHQIPNHKPEYSARLIQEQLLPMIERQRLRDQPLLASIPRKFRLFKTRRPQFHGMSYRDMATAATRFGAQPTPHYIVGGAAYYPASALAVLQTDVRVAWEWIRSIDCVGTEENILSLLSWKHGWPSVPVQTWCRWMAPPPHTTPTSEPRSDRA